MHAFLIIVSEHLHRSIAGLYSPSCARDGLSPPRWDVIVGKKWKIDLLILSHGWGLELIRDEQALKEHQAR